MDIESMANEAHRKLGTNLSLETRQSYLANTRLSSLVDSHFQIHEIPLEDTDGAYIRQKQIHHLFVNSAHTIHRQRFTLAHEYGHFYLDHPSDNCFPDKNSVHEKEANQFASAFLMPRSLMISLNNYYHSMELISDWLMVSHIAIAIRFKEIGIDNPFDLDAIIAGYQIEKVNWR